MYKYSNKYTSIIYKYIYRHYYNKVIYMLYTHALYTSVRVYLSWSNGTLQGRVVFLQVGVGMFEPRQRGTIGVELGSLIGRVQEPTLHTHTTFS